jgi:hypothetical protein
VSTRMRNWLCVALVVLGGGCGASSSVMDDAGPRADGGPLADGGPRADGGPLADGGSTGPDGGGGAPKLELKFDFEDGTPQGFRVDQTDFSVGMMGGLDYAVEALPAPLAGMGLRVRATNTSDDQWSYIARELGPVDGIVGGQRYRATLTVRFASATPSGCIGVGGAPDAVTMKGGVVAIEPGSVTQSGYIGFNVQKGQQGVVGPEAIALGTIGTSGTSCGGNNPWVALERSGTMDVVATSNGRVWIYVGGDSGFESTHTISYDSVAVALTAVP